MNFFKNISEKSKPLLTPYENTNGIEPNESEMDTAVEGGEVNEKVNYQTFFHKFKLKRPEEKLFFKYKGIYLKKQIQLQRQHLEKFKIKTFEHLTEDLNKINTEKCFKELNNSGRKHDPIGLPFTNSFIFKILDTDSGYQIRNYISLANETIDRQLKHYD